MGYLIRVQCSGCGYKNMFRLGCGIRDNRMEEVRQHFGETQRKEIVQYLEQENRPVQGGKWILGLDLDTRRDEYGHST